MKNAAARMAELILEGFTHEFGKPELEIREAPVWKRVRETGSRLWLDTGDIDEASRLWNAAFDALTVNNTLLNKEVQKGMYDDFIRKTASAISAVSPDMEETERILELAFALNAHHCLKLVKKLDAYVSVELHTDLADDFDGTVSYGERFYRICPERFYVKVPLTATGFLAARKLGERGVPVNFTLGFSARQNYVAALLSRPRYTNVFLGRLNSFVAESGLGNGLNVGEKAVLATQRAILEVRNSGRSTTLLIGASMREGAQVASLAGVDVLTMPTKVAADYQKNPVEKTTSQVSLDPVVDLAKGVKLEDFNGSTLWELPDSFKACVDTLLKKDVYRMTAKDLQTHFARAGYGDFLPDWSGTDRQTVAEDGKIPVYQTWKSHLTSGEVGMDALMNISGLYSFATDQKALDDRIRSFL